MPSLKSLLGYAACLVALSASAFADDWSNLATVSMTNATTPKLTNRYMCYTDGRDIRCDSPSLYITTGGLVGINTSNPTTQLEVNGTVSATNFVGDGSGLTNLSVSGDRIVSGTLAAIANTGGYISLTTGGTTWGYFGSANSYLPNMGIGSAPVDTVLTVSGTDRVGFTGTAALQPLTLKGGGTLGNWRGIDFRTYGSWPIGRIGLQYTGSGSYMSFGTSNNYANGVTNQALTIDPQGRVGIGTNSPSTQLHISGSSIVTARIEGDLQGRLLVQTNNGAANQRIYEVMADIQGLKFSNINDAELVRTIFGTFSPSGSLGIGKVTPIAKLDVSGTISASDAIQVGQSTLACTSGISGSIRFNTISGTIQVCNGTGWISLSSGTSAGVTSLAALTDTNITNVAGRDYLRYDAGTSKWVNISESTVMSTTTMVAGWPDGIICTNGTTKVALYLQNTSSSGAEYAIPYDGSTSRVVVQYTTAGAYTNSVNMTGFDCVSSALSITQLYAQGKAFNFIGSANVTGTTALGDRITSGTAPVGIIVNSGTSYISLTNGATTWGYFGFGASLLPQLKVASSIGAPFEVSGQAVLSGRYNGLGLTDRVGTGTSFLYRDASKTYLWDSTGGGQNRITLDNITGSVSFSEAIQVGQSTLACASGISGSIRFNTTSGTIQVCTGTKWESLVSGTGGAGVTSLVALTDTNLTNLAGRDYLRYDSAAGKWKNISESTVMSTTTMVANWPDGIICNVSSPNYGKVTLYSSLMPYSDGLYYYRGHFGGTAVSVVYNSSGTFNSYQNVTTTDCNASIASLYAAGKAFNFIGNANTSGTTVGVSAVASLTDVQLTNLAGRDYLRYDAGTSKWVNISESTVMSTTTMVSGWPDAIICVDTGGTPAPTGREFVFWKNYREGAAGISTYGWNAGGSYYEVNFASSGAYNGKYNAGGQTDSTDCESKSISQLYAMGRAFNFIGSANVSGTTAFGDRITSGTAPVGIIVNSATSYISLTNGATTWGYFGSGNSYLPTLSANLVSSSNISATYVQIQSATTVLACNSGLTGAMRYTSGTMQVCDGSSWGNIGIGVPTGTISAFAAASCPSGWSEYTSARGRFLRGIDNGAGNDPSGTRAAGSTQGDATKVFMNSYMNAIGGLATPQGDSTFGIITHKPAVEMIGIQAVNSPGWGSVNTRTELQGAMDSTYGRAAETRPKNVAVIFCQYDGYQSQLQTGVATLASLSDVSVNGATNGQSLVYSGGTWIASTTTGGAQAASGTGAVQFSTGSNLGGDASTFFWDNASKELGIGTNSPGAKLDVRGTISASDVIQVSGSSLTCGAGLKGAMRYSNTSSTIEYCNGGNWSSMGPSATTAYMLKTMGVDQGSIANGNIIAFNTTASSNNADISATGNQIVLAPGYTYQIGASVRMSGAGGTLLDYRVYDVTNGAYVGAPGNAAASGSYTDTAAVAFVAPTVTTTYDVRAVGTMGTPGANSNGSKFYAFKLGGGGTAGGGTANPAGSTKDIQFNTAGALDADTGLFVYDKTNHRLGVGNSAPSEQLVVGDDLGDVFTGTAAVLGSSASNVGLLLGKDTNNWGRFKWNNGGSGFEISTKQSGVQYDTMQFNNGKVGVGGVSAPVATLDVAGTISASNAIQVSGSSLTCSAGLKGAMRYSNTSSTIEYCQGTAWVSMGPSATDVPAFSVNKNGTNQTVTASTFTKVTFSTEAFDTHNNFDTSTGRFTPTVAGKYLISGRAACTNATTYCHVAVYKNGSSIAASNSYSANFMVTDVGAVVVDMNGSTDYVELWVSNGGGTTIGGNADYTNFAGTLIASGNGLAGGGGATPAGSSNDVQYNSSGALAADTGLFTYNSGVLTAPTMSTGAMTVTGQVSASLISTTYVQIQSATTVLACNSGLTGAMRYTSGTMQVCDGSNWGNIGIGVPTGTISAFAASSCPSGWTEYTASRGRFLRGIDNGAGVDPAGTRSPGNAQADDWKSFTFRGTQTSSGYAHEVYMGKNVGSYAGQYFFGGYWTNPNSGVQVNWDNSEIRPKNVAVIFCQYAGFQSALQVGVATLASLSDVSVAGATNGQALVYNGSAWVPSTTTGGASAASPTGAVQFSTGSNLGGDATNFFWDNAAKELGIGTNAPGAKLDVRGTISASDVIQVSGSSLTCSAGLKGAIRYSNTSNTLEYCNSTAWTSVGPSTSIPAFSVHKNGASQTVSSGVYTKLVWSTERFDTNNDFGADRFMPTVPGKYLVTLNVYCVAATQCVPAIYKNGVIYAVGNTQVGVSGGSIVGAVAIIDMNGSTDYVEGYVNDAGGTTIGGDAGVTYFSGALLSGGGSGGGGGTATPAGSSNDVQFNNAGALAAATGVFTYNSGLLTAPTISTGGMAVSGQLSAGTISSTIVQVSGSSLSCNSGVKGAMRYSNTSNTLEYCNSTAWVSAGPSATTPVAFSAVSGGQSIPSQVFTKLTFGSVNFDTNTNFASNRFTVSVPGKYILTAQSAIDFASYGTAAEAWLTIFKNGTTYASGNRISTGSLSSVYPNVTTIADAGIGDYFEAYIYVYTQNGSAQSLVASRTVFSGVLLASQGGSGGGATPAGSTGDIQFNNGGTLAADTNQLFWDATNNRLGIGTNAPAYPLEVNGSVAATDYYQSSDRKLKESITQLQSGLAVVEKLNPVRFRWKASGKFAYGLIAQDVQQVLPEAVGMDGKGRLSIEYSQVMPWLIQGMKELKAANDNLSVANENLRYEIELLRGTNGEILRRLETLERKAGGAR